MEWIHINRKLPDSSAPVLIATRRYIALASWNAEERRCEMESREDAAMISSRDITHWMPMPELPKERHNDWERELLLCDGVSVESRLPGVPVEYTGKAFDKEYYFRSRGKRWSMAIAETVDQAVEATGADDPLRAAEFFCTGRYSDDEFAAGYMPLEQAEELIRRCVRLWKAGQEESARAAEKEGSHP
jgi:hypothetical protein